MNQRLDATTLRRMAGLLTQSEAAAALNVDRWTFFGRIRAGAWPKPRVTIGRGRRHYYGPDQIEELRRLVGGQAA
jgi:hypothetical protein